MHVNYLVIFHLYTTPLILEDLNQKRESKKISKLEILVSKEITINSLQDLSEF